jgi:hypothetical protein
MTILSSLDKQNFWRSIQLAVSVLGVWVVGGVLIGFLWAIAVNEHGSFSFIFFGGYQGLIGGLVQGGWVLIASRRKAVSLLVSLLFGVVPILVMLAVPSMSVSAPFDKGDIIYLAFLVAAGFSMSLVCRAIINCDVREKLAF